MLIVIQGNCFQKCNAYIAWANSTYLSCTGGTDPAKCGNTADAVLGGGVGRARLGKDATLMIVGLGGANGKSTELNGIGNGNASSIFSPFKLASGSLGRLADELGSAGIGLAGKLMLVGCILMKCKLDKSSL